MNECDVRENCKSYDRGDCWHCRDYSLYWPEDKRILCERQIRERKERRLARKLKQESVVARKARRSKSKGREGENEVVKLLAKYGIKAERVPLSGALKTEKYSCDVVLFNGKRIEVKRRKTGMKTIKKWLEEDRNSNYVFFREDGNTEGWVVIMPYMELVELLQMTQGWCGSGERKAQNLL